MSLSSCIMTASVEYFYLLIYIVIDPDGGYMVCTFEKYSWSYTLMVFHFFYVCYISMNKFTLNKKTTEKTT